MAQEALVGRILGSAYRVERRLGAGGIGAVYAASHVRTGRRYAVKVLLPEVALTTGAAERFKREADSLAALGHAGIVQIHDFDTAEDGTQFLVMDLLDGEDLATRIGRDGAIEWTHALRVLDELGGALMVAHEVGIVHRDLKPANVFLARKPGSPERATILDFGLAKNVTSTEDVRLTATGAGLGTPLYMSPEQARGADVDLRTDVYALGCILFEMLTGVPPFQGTTLTAVIARILTEPPPSVSHASPKPVPPGIDEVVKKALAKAAEDRYPTAQALVDAARRAGAGWSLAEPLAATAFAHRQALAATVASTPPPPLASIEVPVPTPEVSAAVTTPRAPAGAWQSGDARRESAPASGSGAVEVGADRGASTPGGTPFSAPATTQGLAPGSRRIGPLWLGLGGLAVAVLASVITTLAVGGPRTTQAPPPAMPSVENERATEETPSPELPRVAGNPSVVEEPGAPSPDELLDGPSGERPAAPTIRAPRRPVSPTSSPVAAVAQPAGDPTPLERQATAVETQVALQEQAHAALGQLTPDQAAIVRARIGDAVRTYETNIRAAEQRVRAAEAFMPLVLELRRQARSVARGDVPAACTGDLRQRLVEAARGDDASIASSASMLDATLDPICVAFEDWETPPPAVRSRLAEMPRELDYAERMLGESPPSAPESAIARVRDALADLRRLHEAQPASLARYPCRDGAVRALREAQNAGAPWPSAAAQRVYRHLDRACNELGVSETRLADRSRALADRTDAAEQQLRQQIQLQNDNIARFRAAILQVQAGVP